MGMFPNISSMPEKKSHAIGVGEDLQNAI